MRRYCLALDLIDDESLIAEYKEHHIEVWPEIKKSILDSGVDKLEIYHNGTRLFMIMEVSSDFSFENKEKMDSNNPKVQQWEDLMWKYQKAIPTAKDNEKWVLMDRIFKLKKSS